MRQSSEGAGGVFRRPFTLLIIISTFFIGVILQFICISVSAQDEWPKTVSAADGIVITIYQPQVDSFHNNILEFRSAISVSKRTVGMQSYNLVEYRDSTGGQYGSIRGLAVFETDRNARLISLSAINILGIKFSGAVDPRLGEAVKETLECGMPGAGLNLSIDHMIGAMGDNPGGYERSAGLNNNPPSIVVASRPSMLVLIDGVPRLKRNPDWDLNVVVNSPYAIAEASDSWYYLYGGRHWYIAPVPMGPFFHSGHIPVDLYKVQQRVDQINEREGEHSDTVREGADILEDIIIRFGPAELLTIKGTPVVTSIAGTSLFYVQNSDNDIFLDSMSCRYYVLLSGRWYTSEELNGAWKYVSSDSLPSDFGRIPEGSPKDRVLASVAGTDAAREAVLDASIPQTAKVDRHTAKASVGYDGVPQWAGIAGTGLQYAVNAAGVVIRSKNRFWYLDKGVWFESEGAKGPWSAASERPPEVEKIPPECPVYHSQFVFIYEVTPDYIYTGYTSGYLNSYIAHNTVVYGTGYYYPSWVGNVSYPRPWTWGFNMTYSPWFGWCLGYGIGLDWLNTSNAWAVGYWSGGWWGPSVYRPPYVWHHFSGHGLYERNPGRLADVSYNNNIYQYRQDIVRQAGPERVWTDMAGDVYRMGAGGHWMKREGNIWRPLNGEQSVVSQLNMQEQRWERGEMRCRNFRQENGGIGRLERQDWKGAVEKGLRGNAGARNDALNGFADRKTALPAQH